MDKQQGLYGPNRCHPSLNPSSMCYNWRGLPEYSGAFCPLHKLRWAASLNRLSSPTFAPGTQHRCRHLPSCQLTQPATARETLFSQFTICPSSLHHNPVASQDEPCSGTCTIGDHHIHLAFAVTHSATLVCVLDRLGSHVLALLS